jgi:hypothetical protein
MIAEETLPTRKNFSAASTAIPSRLRHQLERNEQQDEIARGGEHQHPKQRGEDEQMVLPRPSLEGRVGRRDAAQQADHGGDEEEPLGEDRQTVLHECAAQP